jgi:hypothetical protein
MTIPTVSAPDLSAFARELFPAATVTHIPMNPEHQSWRIEIRGEESRLEIFWGPLSGFGGTDVLALNDDENPFAPYDVGFDSLEAAKAWLRLKKKA